MSTVEGQADGMECLRVCFSEGQDLCLRGSVGLLGNLRLGLIGSHRERHA